jgi:hypothetical protein
MICSANAGVCWTPCKCLRAGPQARVDNPGGLGYGEARAMSHLRLPSILALVTFLSGCAAQLVYQPNDAVLDGMTREQREQLFVETLSRAIKPRIVQVWIDDASYGYDSAVAVRDGFGIPVGYYPGRRRGAYFANIRELRLYDNNAVFVVDTNGSTIDKLVFGYRDDAQRMIDLIAAYRARRYSGAAETEPPPDRRRERRLRQPPPYDPRNDRRYDPRWDGPPPGYYPPPGYDGPPPGYDGPPPGYDGPPPGYDGPPPGYGEPPPR